MILNLCQIVFLNSQTDLGRLVGEILSKTTGLSYWDNPFQVIFIISRILLFHWFIKRVQRKLFNIVLA